MQVKEGSHATVNIKRPKKMAKTQLTQTEKLVDPISRACCEDHSYDLRSSIKRTKKKNSRKVVSRKMVYFKIMKLVYYNFIYTKTF